MKHCAVPSEKVGGVLVSGSAGVTVLGFRSNAAAFTQCLIYFGRIEANSAPDFIMRQNSGGNQGVNCPQ